MSLKINKLEIGYYAYPENNERRFELSILGYFLHLFRGTVELMEVGAVSPYYYAVNHEVYDATERGAINKFAEDLDYTGRSLVSISTIEHIGKGDYGLKVNPYRCITALNKMLEATHYLITFPIGYNTLLDAYVNSLIMRMDAEKIYTFHRDINNDWYLDSAPNFSYKYNSPLPLGNGVCVISNLKEFKE